MPLRRKCHKDIILPQTGWNPNTLSWYVPLLACGLFVLPSLTHTLKDLPIPPWAVGDNAPCSTFIACGLLVLPGLIHTLKDLPFLPLGSREWRVTQYLFCIWSFGPMGSSSHTLEDLPVSCKVGASNLACRHEDRIITCHKDVVTKTRG